MMRIDVVTKTLTTAAAGVLLDIPCSSHAKIAAAVDVTSIAGSPTNFTVSVVPKQGSVVFDNGNALNTGAKTTAGQYPLDLWGTTVLTHGPFIHNTFTEWEALLAFTAGTSPTITGVLYIYLI